MPGSVAPCCPGWRLGSRPAGLLPSDLATQTGIMQGLELCLTLRSPTFTSSSDSAASLSYQACEENAELCGAAASLISGQGPPGSPEVCTRPSRIQQQTVPVIRPDVLEIISCFRARMKSVPLLAGVVGVEQSLVLSVL
ncbi:hypothetical protein MHYP_G00301520 [Metynnis hypsauchen]